MHLENKYKNEAALLELHQNQVSLEVNSDSIEKQESCISSEKKQASRTHKISIESISAD